MRLKAKEVSVVLFREYSPEFKTNFLLHLIIKISLTYIVLFPSSVLYNQQTKIHQNRTNKRNYTVFTLNTTDIMEYESNA